MIFDVTVFCGQFKLGKGGQTETENGGQTEMENGGQTGTVEGGQTDRYFHIIKRTQRIRTT